MPWCYQEERTGGDSHKKYLRNKFLAQLVYHESNKLKYAFSFWHAATVFT